MDVRKKKHSFKTTNQNSQQGDCNKLNDSELCNRNKKMASNGWTEEKVNQNRLNNKKSKAARRKLYKNFEEYVNNKYRTRISSSEHDFKYDQALRNNLRLKRNISSNLNSLKQTMVKHNDFKSDGESVTSHKISRCYSEKNQLVFEEYTVNSSRKNQHCFDDHSNVTKSFKRTIMQYNGENNGKFNDESHNKTRFRCSKKSGNRTSSKQTKDNILNVELSDCHRDKSTLLNQSPPCITSSDADDEDVIDSSKMPYLSCEQENNGSSVESEVKTDVPTNNIFNSDLSVIRASFANSLLNTDMHGITNSKRANNILNINLNQIDTSDCHTCILKQSLSGTSSSDTDDKDLFDSSKMPHIICENYTNDSNLESEVKKDVSINDKINSDIPVTSLYQSNFLLNNKYNIKKSKQISNILNVNSNENDKSNSLIFESWLKPSPLHSRNGANVFKDVVVRSKIPHILYKMDANGSRLKPEDETEISTDFTFNSDKPVTCSTHSNSLMTLSTINENCISSYELSLNQITGYQDMNADSCVKIPWKQIFPNFRCQMHYPYREIWWMSHALINICRQN